MINVLLDSKRIDGLLRINDQEIDVSFNDGTLSEVQPVLTLNEAEFVGSAINIINDFIDTNGVFKQLPISFDVRDDNNQIDVFKGYLSNYNFNPDRCIYGASIIAEEGIDTLADKLSVLTAPILEDLYSPKLLRFIVEKPDIKQDLIMLSLSIVTYAYILYTQIKEIINFAARAVEAASDSASLSFGAVLALALEAVALISFLAVTVVQLTKYVAELFELLIPRRRKMYVLSAKDLLETPLKYLGYNLVTDIEDLDKVYHWRSGKVNDFEFIPNSDDQCYTALGCFELFMNKFNARISVIGKTVYFLNSESEFFKSKSTYTLPNVNLKENYRYNTDEIVGSKLINYTTDTSDEWTFENFKGTRYLVTTNIDDPTCSTVTGYNSTDYGVALCSRKDKLNDLEKLWEEFIDFANQAISLFGGGAQKLKIPSRLGMAKISSESLSVAKLVYLQGDKLPKNHRNLLSAKSDYDNYHVQSSFALNKEKRHHVYSGITIPYCMSSFVKNIQNAYFSTSDGRTGKFTSIKWNPDKDTAVVDFWLIDDFKVYLTEQYYEAQS